MNDPRFSVTPERPITPDNARLSTEWFASCGGDIDGAFKLNDLDVAHIAVTADGIVQVAVVQPGDEHLSRNYPPIEINMAPWRGRDNTSSDRRLPRPQSTEEGGVVADIDGIDATYRILAENGANDFDGPYAIHETIPNRAAVLIAEGLTWHAAMDYVRDLVAKQMDVEPEPIIQHTFTVAAENIGGQNHGRDMWLEYVVDTSGIDPGPVTQIADEGPAWLIEYKDTSGQADEITVQGTERFLRFLCVLFDLHAEQYPGDDTPKAEAEKLEHSIAVAKVAAMPDGPEKAKRLYELNGWLTVGQFRQATAGQPDDKLITFYDGNWYTHVQLVTEGPGDEPTVILAGLEPFDTRHI